METLSFLELTENEMDDAARKNEFVVQSETDYLAILNIEKISGNRIADRIQSDNLFCRGEVLVFCSGCSADVAELSVDKLLNCYTLEIIGLVFHGEMIGHVGAYNEYLEALTDFELVCRLTEYADKCLVVFDNVAESVLQVTEGALFGYAYLIRRYLQKMYRWNIAEAILRDMYQIAEAAGKAEYWRKCLQQMLSDDGTYERIAWNTAPYVVFRGDDTCYGVLRDFADSLTESLRKIGRPVLALESGKIDYDYLQHNICRAFVGFQTVAFGIDFFQKLSGKKIQFWLDNPIFYKKSFETIPGECYVLCQDMNYVTFIKEQYHMENVMHMPPGGHAQSPNFNMNRPYDIVFIGGYAPETEWEMEDWEWQYYNYMLAHPNKTFTQGLQEVQQKWEDSDKERISETLTHLKPVCQRIINHYRKRVIDVILEAGYELHVYGDTWNEYHSSWEGKLIRHPAVSVDESLQEWRKAKIGLNVMSWHKAGMTERIANIMLAGTACLSDETEYLRQNFVEGEQIVCFQLDKLDELPEKIENLFVNDRWLHIAQEGYMKALSSHTWLERAKWLDDFVGR